MKTIETYLEAIADASQKTRMIEIITWIKKTYPRLEGVIKWNQPMFTDHGTFIIGFNMAKHHLSFNPEPQIIDMFKDDIHAAGYETTMALAKIKWTDEVDYKLLDQIISFNIQDKKDYSNFFRKDW